MRRARIQASGMLHLVLTVLLIDEPQPAQYTATALSAAQIFEREKSSVGDLESGGYEIDSHGSGGGVTVKTKEVRSGDDYRVDQENGLVHTSYGYYHGQAWSQSANGAVILSSRFRESLDTPGARAFQHPDDPASGVKVLGITAAVPQQLVVEVHPNDGNDQYRYYDPKTCA